MDEGDGGVGMGPITLKVALAGVLVLLLLVVGAGAGGWLSTGHYRPLLDAANSDLSTVKAGRDNLDALAGEQGRKLGELVLAGPGAGRSVGAGTGQAKKPSTTTSLLINCCARTGGDPARAAASSIDQELGL